MKFYTGKYKITGTICTHLSLAWIVALTLIVQITTNDTGEIKFFILFIGLILLSLAWQLLSIPLKWICIDRKHLVCHTLFKTTTIVLKKVGIIHYKYSHPSGKRSATMVLIFHDKHALTEIDCSFIDMEIFLNLFSNFKQNQAHSVRTLPICKKEKERNTSMSTQSSIC
ncbi:hypothetical protein [Listeria costaricensis]|uniref:hypothetical protein n=1 Tax=Listeria costaricensis TaxID=2026604 RepID=UPI000C072765|nr:hypothetical protein [Listeria costaricensis]